MGAPANVPAARRSVVRAVFLDARRRVGSQTTELPFAATTSYVYREGTVVAPRGRRHGPPPPRRPRRPAVFVDDVRVLDDNLLINGGFETRSPTGRDDDAPDWRFEAGGARVITEPANVRGGTRAVALDGIPTDFRQVTQEIRSLTGAPRYRVTAWLEDRRHRPRHRHCPPASTPAATRSSPTTTSDGTYRLRRAEITAPPGAQRLTIRLRLDTGTTGTAYFDDLLVELLG